MNHPFFIISPAEAVDEISIIRTDRKSPADQINRLIQADPFFGKSIAEIIESIRMLGIELNRLLHLFHQIVETIELVISCAQMKMKIGQFRILFDSFDKILRGLIISIQFV